jgi:hypothetical protein
MALEELFLVLGRIRRDDARSARQRDASEPRQDEAKPDASSYSILYMFIFSGGR